MGTGSSGMACIAAPASLPPPASYGQWLCCLVTVWKRLSPVLCARPPDSATEPCAGPCPFPACLDACAQCGRHSQTRVRSQPGTAGGWWRLGVLRPQLSAPTPCHRPGKGPSRCSPLPGETHGGGGRLLRAPPVPSQPPGRGERRYRPPACAGPWAAGADLALAGQACRAGPGPICMCLRPPPRCCEIINPCHLLPGSVSSLTPVCPAPAPWLGLAGGCSPRSVPGGMGERGERGGEAHAAPAKLLGAGGFLMVTVSPWALSQPSVGVEPCPAATGMSAEPGGTE